MARLRHGDELVAEDALAREAGDELADHAHGRQDHDVDGGVRVEPEQVLEEHRVAAQRGVEDAEVQRRARGPPAGCVIAITGVPSTMMRLVA